MNEFSLSFDSRKDPLPSHAPAFTLLYSLPEYPLPVDQ